MVLTEGESNKIAPTFYISSRRRSGGTVSFKCYDRTIYTDRQFEVSDGIFETDGENAGTVESYWLAQHISQQCGFAGFGIVGTISEVPQIHISREYVTGKSCRSLLSAVSAAWCGYFRVTNDDYLVFSPFGGTHDIRQSHSHTAISEGGSKGPIEQLIVSNGTETFINGNSSADVFGTLKLSAELADRESAASVFERVKGYVYQSWSCDKAIIDNGAGDMETDAEIAFADGSLRTANRVEAVLTSCGFICTCGRNDVVEDEFDYTGAISREIEKRIADGEVLGGKWKLSRYEGIEVFSEDSAPISTYSVENSNSKVISRYGFNVGKNGFTEFEGDLVSAKVFDSAEKIDDNTIVITYPGNVRYKYTKEKNGNTVKFKKERLEAEKIE